MTRSDRALEALTDADPIGPGWSADLVAPIRLLHSILSQPIAEAPRHSRREPRVLLAAAFAVALLAVVVFVGGSMIQPPSAFATWTALPTRLDPAFAEQMQENCALRAPSDDDPDLDPELRAAMANQRRVFATLPLVVMDQRGRAAVALFAARLTDGQASVMCMTVAAKAGGRPVAGGGGSSTGAIESPRDGPLRLFTAQRNSSDAGIYTSYAGHVDPEVAQVTLERSEGGGVTASVSDGYFVAWWPGDAYATNFVAYGAGGETLAKIDNNGWDFQDPTPDPSPYPSREQASLAP
jgi:hypothetical protein